MYLCQICGACSEPGQSKQVHYIYRHIPYTPSEKTIRHVSNLTNPTRTEIAKEIPVCNQCQILLTGGIPLHVLLRQNGGVRRMGTCEPINNHLQDVARKMSRKISNVEIKVPEGNSIPNTTSRTIKVSGGTVRSRA